MKSVLLILIACFYTVTGLYAQKKISVSYKNVKLFLVLKELNFKTGLTFLSDAECFQNTQPVTLKADNITLDNLLKKIFARQSVKYTRTKNCIIITPKNITGQVVDTDGNPISNVLVRASHQATITNNNGYFFLQHASCAPSIQFLYAKESMELPVHGKTNIVVVMRLPPAFTEIPIDTNSASIQPYADTGLLKHSTNQDSTGPLLKRKKNG